MVEGSVGFGFALRVVPTPTLVHPEVLPTGYGTPADNAHISATMAVRERCEIDVAGRAYLLLGRVGGTFGVRGSSRWCLAGSSACCSAVSPWWPYSRAR